MNKAQSRRERNVRKGHAHSPPVRKLEIVEANMRVSLSLITLTSGSLQGSIHQARAKSPTQGAYAPIFGAGQGALRDKVRPKTTHQGDTAYVGIDGQVTDFSRKSKNDLKTKRGKSWTGSGTMRNGMANQEAKIEPFGTGRQSHLPKRTGDNYKKWMEEHPNRK